MELSERTVCPFLFPSGESPVFPTKSAWDRKAKMYCHIHTGGLRGLESYVAQVEVDVSMGLPCFEMVGLLASEVKEARERIRVALRNAGVKMPAEKITVNISPAGIHKAGTAFDLPVAVGIVAAQGMLLPTCFAGVLVAGELGLDASVKPIRGVLPMVLEGVRQGITEFVLPLGNLSEGMLAEEASVMGVESLEEAIRYLRCDGQEREKMRKKAALQRKAVDNPEEPDEREAVDYGDLYGMREAKLAALTSAAGFHNVLFIGPPGAGKTMLARGLPSILPPLEPAERREVSAIYSVAGRLPKGKLIRRRPFVSPHHTVSGSAMAGGGSVPMPGMVTLAHRGVLFLDEMAQFRRATLDILRQPMEDGRIFLAKGGGHFVYPADFMLAASANPCPCGFYPDRNRCRCTPWEIHQYFSRISGPLLDRIDLCCSVQPVSFSGLWDLGRRRSGNALQAEKGWDSAAMRERVMAARERQTHRYAGTGIAVNGRLRAGDILRYCRLGEKEQRYMEEASQSLHCSARACHRVLRVARTLADLEGAEEIGIGHLGQALHYRKGEEPYRT